MWGRCGARKLRGCAHTHTHTQFTNAINMHPQCHSVPLSVGCAVHMALAGSLVCVCTFDALAGAAGEPRRASKEDRVV